MTKPKTNRQEIVHFSMRFGGLTFRRICIYQKRLDDLCSYDFPLSGFECPWNITMSCWKWCWYFVDD